VGCSRRSVQDIDTIHAIMTKPAESFMSSSLMGSESETEISRTGYVAMPGPIASRLQECLGERRKVD
jgi:hypothetical protein